jgi:MFS family permease
LTATSASRLGKDFWLYQFGQLVSTIGDACGNIALAWWILDAAKSPQAISRVLAPAMAVQLLLTPLAGPLGDAFSRKYLIMSSDVLRGIAIGVIAWLAAVDRFSFPAVTVTWIVFACGSALFSSNNLSIVPQIVAPASLEGAVRTSQSLQAIGRVLGGLVAAGLVTWLGIAAAFIFDAASFAIAAIATAAISNIAPRRTTDAPFTQQLKDGFRVVGRVPVLLALALAIAFFNLILSPMQVLLPTYAKVLRGMPAWFLGGLESALGAGIIIGAVSISFVERLRGFVSSVTIGLMLLGGSMAVLAHVPGVLAPIGAMLMLGIGAAWTNIPIGTRVSVAVPDHFRARVNSIIAFIFDACAPIGVAAGGVLAVTLGVTQTMTWMGGIVLAAVPALFKVRALGDFFRVPPDELDGYLLKKYPRAFVRDS